MNAVQHAAFAYDTVPYPSDAFPQTDPRRTSCLARLFGLSPVNPHKARVLELGCASGGNLLPLAARLPDCEFTGVDYSSRQIEEARCYRALECGISLASPVHRGDDVAACVKFYKDDCLHGLASKNDPGGPKLQACVQAISGGVCSVVVAPETDPACAFLIPAPAAVVDAGADVDAAARPATDAASD